jgi:hypothetical protein
VSLAYAHARLWAILRTTRAASLEVRRAFAALEDGVPAHRVPALLESDAIVVPFATGVLAPIIVVPACAAERLSPAALRTMLAHELAHVLRRDPSWRVLLVALERVLFFQPLLRLARRGVEHDAEYLCDAWAASRTAAPLELARCLTEIASWSRGPRRLAFATTMAEPRSILRRRVLRLVGSDAPVLGSSRRVLLLAVLACAILPFVAPAVAGARSNPTKTIVIRSAPDRGDAPQEIVVVTPGHAPVVVPAPPPAQVDEPRADKRERKKAERRTTRDLRRTIRRARRDDRLPTVDELAAVLDAQQLAAPHIAQVDDMVIVVDPEGLTEARAIVVELDAIIAGSTAIADAARANAERRHDVRSRALERQARALRQRAAAHRDAARALRMRVIGDEAIAPPAPPAPPRPPRGPMPPDIVPALAPIP